LIVCRLLALRNITCAAQEGTAIKVLVPELHLALQAVVGRTVIRIILLCRLLLCRLLLLIAASVLLAGVTPTDTLTITELILAATGHAVLVDAAILLAGVAATDTHSVTELVLAAAGRALPLVPCVRAGGRVHGFSMKRRLFSP